MEPLLEAYAQPGRLSSMLVLGLTHLSLSHLRSLLSVVSIGDTSACGSGEVTSSLRHFLRATTP